LCARARDESEQQISNCWQRTEDVCIFDMDDSSPHVEVIMRNWHMLEKALVDYVVHDRYPLHYADQQYKQAVQLEV
jgi:hypothetical protein